MQRIPRPALQLGLAGLLPFAYGAATAFAPGLALTPLAGVALLNLYGIIILCFMAGVLWGFAARAEGEAGYVSYAVSTAPAVFILLAAAFWPAAFQAAAGLVLLAVSFLALLGFDFLFSQKGLTPIWWMRLRTLLTSGVTLCLVLGAAA